MAVNMSTNYSQNMRAYYTRQLLRHNTLQTVPPLKVKHTTESITYSSMTSFYVLNYILLGSLIALIASIFYAIGKVL